MFSSGIGELDRAWLRYEVEGVMSYFNDRYGVIVPEFSLYLSEDLDKAARLYQELTGSEFPAATGHARACSGNGVVTTTIEVGTVGFVGGPLVLDCPAHVSAFLAHEYYHMIEHHLLRLDEQQGPPIPTWIVEGAAQHDEDLYMEEFVRSGLESRPAWQGASLQNPAPFAEIAGSFSPGHYRIAALAIDWLQSHSGNPRAPVDFWSELAEQPDWREAFSSTFGITHDEFLGAFEAYRAALIPDRASVSGRIEDLRGNALAGVAVIATSPNSSWEGESGEDGRFTISVLPGSYDLLLGRRVAASASQPFDAIFYDFVYDPESGYSNVCESIPIPVRSEGVDGLIIKVAPELLGRTEQSPCNEGVPGHHLIRGVILDMDGDPLMGSADSGDWVLITAHAAEDTSTSPQDVPDGITTTAGGEFVMALPDMRSFVLLILRPDERRGFVPIGWYGLDVSPDDGAVLRTFTTQRTEASEIHIDGADITNIEIHLPRPLAELHDFE